MSIATRPSYETVWVRRQDNGAMLRWLTQLPQRSRKRISSLGFFAVNRREHEQAAFFLWTPDFKRQP
jgi:hypothetical protein